MVLLLGLGEFWDRYRVIPQGCWRPEKLELEDWFKKQIQEFSIKENRNAKLTAKKWKNKYIFTEVYEIFFVTFAHELQEWLARLVEFQTCWKDDQVMQWTPELIQQLEKADNTITRMVDHWVDSVLGWFLMEFTFNQF